MIAVIAGARPNFIKIAPLLREMSARCLPYILIHTGQHYDYEMSAVFFEHLEIPEPDINLGIGSGSDAFQIGKAIIGLAEAYEKANPKLVVVVGDVNSTLAGAIAAAIKRIKVAHVEAGLRSFDRGMQEEINRVLTDAVSDLLFTPSRDANMNLLREGIDDNKIFFVGNIMIDALVQVLPLIRNAEILERLSLGVRQYIYITLHRASNVDSCATLAEIVDSLRMVNELGLQMVFPAHPRTSQRLKEFGLMEKVASMKCLRLMQPLGYIESITLIANAMTVLTDSGGIQEETTYLGVPCLTLRKTTERPVTIIEGTNTLLSKGPSEIIPQIERILSGETKEGKIPELWDGKTSKRVVDILSKYY